MFLSEITDDQLESVFIKIDAVYKDGLIFRDLFTHSLLPSAFVSLDGKFEQVNASFANMLGYTIKELETKSWMEVTRQDHILPDLDKVEECLYEELKSYKLFKIYLHKKSGDVPAVLVVTKVIIEGIDQFLSQVFPLGWIEEAYSLVHKKGH